MYKVVKEASLSGRHSDRDWEGGSELAKEGEQ